MQDGECLKFQVRCVSQYPPVQDINPAIDIHNFFMGILEKLGIFYFESRQIYTDRDRAFSVRNMYFKVWVPEVGALF